MVIELGDKVRDINTGFIGIAVAKTEFINGCVQYGVVPRVAKGDNKYPDEVHIDEDSLEVITPKKKPIIKRDTGGPVRIGKRMRGF